MTETTTRTPKVGDVVETTIPLPPLPVGAVGIINSVLARGTRERYLVDFVLNDGSITITCWPSDLRVVGTAPSVVLDSSSPSLTVLVVVHDPTNDSIVITGAYKPGEKPTPPAIVAGILRRAAMDVAKRHGINSADGLAEVLAGSAVTDA